jgi:hypothetical protein
MHKPVEDHVLESFITKKYHWKGLTTEQQMSLAIEVSRQRYLLKNIISFIDEAMQDKNAGRHYRSLVANQGEP